ncbi:hypothetical protein ACQ4PT_045333 [Festuca glaucescens]
MGGGKKVGRANELLKPDEIIDQVDFRSIAASPLPYNVKLEDVQSFFAQHGKVDSVRLPKHVSDKRHFCGTALVEFSEEEEANGVMEKKLSFAGVDLEMKPKKEFDTEREAKKEAYEKSNTKKHGHAKKERASISTKESAIGHDEKLQDLEMIKLQELNQILKDTKNRLAGRREAIFEGLMQSMQGEDDTKQVKIFEQTLSPEQREVFLN